MISPGQRLRNLRESLGLTLRDVEAASTLIAARHQKDEFAVNLSRLSDIESKGVLPTVYRLYSLAVIYRRDFRELLSWYDVDLTQAVEDSSVVSPHKTHIANITDNLSEVRMPVRMDPGFNLKKTCAVGRMVERWGSVPFAMLSSLTSGDYTYGYIGSEDLTMFPILLPGSFVQVDESRTDVVRGGWHSEYERPIYFLEMREGFACCWCSVEGNRITLQPHPLSPVPVRVMEFPREADVLGQVVGVAMRLDQWRIGNGAHSSRELKG